MISLRNPGYFQFPCRSAFCGISGDIPFQAEFFVALFYPKNFHPKLSALWKVKVKYVQFWIGKWELAGILLAMIWIILQQEPISLRFLLQMGKKLFCYRRKNRINIYIYRKEPRPQVVFFRAKRIWGISLDSVLTIEVRDWPPSFSTPFFRTRDYFYLLIIKYIWFI